MHLRKSFAYHGEGLGRQRPKDILSDNRRKFQCLNFVGRYDMHDEQNHYILSPRYGTMSVEKSKTKTIFHIGMQRTGTTFFQYEVFPMLNIRYITPSFFFKYGSLGTLAEFYRYILTEDTLISNENIYADMWNKEDTRFERLEVLNKLFPDAKIILGVRDRESLKKSWYKKSIASGAVWTFEEFLQSINLKLFDYEVYIERLMEMFQDVYVYKYEDFRENPGKVVKKMCDFMGLETPKIEKEAYNRKWNIGYTQKQIKFARIINKLFKTRLNPDGIIPLRYELHPHRMIFQKDIIFKLQGKSTELPPVYPASK